MYLKLCKRPVSIISHIYSPFKYLLLAGCIFGGSSVSLTFITIPFLQEEYRNSMPASSFQQQKLRVCEVCSAYLGLHDNDRRLADHFGGKLHLGFIQIREKLDQLRVCSWIVFFGETRSPVIVLTFLSF